VVTKHKAMLHPVEDRISLYHACVISPLLITISNCSTKWSENAQYLALHMSCQ